METEIRNEELTKTGYLKKPHRVIGLLSYAFGGAGTLCTILYTDLPDWVKLLAGILYGVLIGSAVISLINRSVINYYLEIAEELYKDEDIANIRKENILPFFKQVKRFYVESGIADIKKEIADYSEIISHISEAKSDIKIIVYFGDRFILQTKNILIEAINRGVNVKLLIAERNSVLLDEVWKLEKDDKSTRWDVAKRAVDEIEAQTTNGIGTFLYHKYNTQSRYALIMVDGVWAWWTPYHPGIDVGKTSSFVLVDKGNKSIIRQCKEHFKKLWEKHESTKTRSNP